MLGQGGAPVSAESASINAPCRPTPAGEACAPQVRFPRVLNALFLPPPPLSRCTCLAGSTLLSTTATDDLTQQLKTKMSTHEEDLIDYEDEHDVVANGAPAQASNAAAATAPAADGTADDKKNFSGIHSTGFRYVVVCPARWVLQFTTPATRDFLLKPELLRAISDLGFEHPSEGEYIARIS